MKASIDRMQQPKQQQLLTLVLIVLVSTSFVVCGQTPSAKTKPIRSVTGHYVMRRDAFHNRLDVEQLPGGKIKFDLVALWVSQNNPENVHNGEIQAIVSLENGVAVYEEGQCRIRMEFLPTRVRIAENGEVGDCGFGVNVTAAGSYRKIDTKKPKFDF